MLQAHEDEPRMRDEIAATPNDRLIRGGVLCVAIAWWLGQIAQFAPDGAGRMTYVPIWLAPLFPMLWLLAWVTLGRWVFRVSDGNLLVERRLMTITFWWTAHPAASLSGFRVEEQRKKIKGNTSPRYRVLMCMENGTHEVAWFRRRDDAETLARQLQLLTREYRTEE